MIEIESTPTGNAIIYAHDAETCPFAFWKLGRPHCTIDEEPCPVNYDAEKETKCPLVCREHILVVSDIL